jgi:hypothetical protein
VFDGTQIAGSWKVYVADDDPAHGDGFLEHRPEIVMQARAKAPVAFTSATAEVPEGTTRTLTLRRVKPAGSNLGPATVKVAASPRSAGTGDFAALDETVVFAAGQEEATIPVRSLTGDAIEPQESFEVLLGESTGDAAPAGPVTVTIPAQSEPGPGTGDGQGPGTGDAADRVAPKVTGLRLAKRSIRFALSERAAVQVRVQRYRGRWVTVRRIRRAAAAGANRVGVRLRAGRYRAVVRAKDDAGNASTRTSRRTRVA